MNEPTDARVGALCALGAFGHGSLGADFLLVASGAVTAAPLLLFAAGARRLKLTTLGFFQYVAPTLTFLLGVFACREPIGAA